MMHKGRVYHMLNEQLQHEATMTSDTSILGVAQMVIDSWYWGATADLKAHIRGLKQMIRLRGGLDKLGLHGFLSKTVIMCVLPSTSSEIVAWIHHCFLAQWKLTGL